MELLGSEFLISHTFQRRRYISIARRPTGNLIMYAVMETIPFSDLFCTTWAFTINFLNAPGIETLPQEMQRNFSVMRDLDQRTQGEVYGEGKPVVNLSMCFFFFLVYF